MATTAVGSVVVNSLVAAATKSQCQGLSFYKVSKGAKIRNQYNQVPHLTHDKLVSSFKPFFDIQVVESILQLLYEKHSFCIHFATDALQAQMV